MPTAARQLAAYLDKLQQPNGLFFHGPDFHYFWGRGNGWCRLDGRGTSAVCQPITRCGPGIMSGYKTMMAALLVPVG